MQSSSYKWKGELHEELPNESTSSTESSDETSSDSSTTLQKKGKEIYTSKPDDDDQTGNSDDPSHDDENSDEDMSEPKSRPIDNSSTESDEDDDDVVDDDEDVPKETPAKSSSKLDKITQDILERYQKRQGRQLYIRFPQKLPEDNAEFETKVKSLSELIVRAHKPRQKHARFCLVDFECTADRDTALKKLKKKSEENHLVVSLPRTEGDDFVKSLTEKKLKQLEKKRAKQLLKKQSRKDKKKEFTSSIVVLNIPKSASLAQIKELFPDAVDLQIKPGPSRFDGASIATVTLPSTADARNNVKKSLTLGGVKLIIRFNNPKKKKSQKKPQKSETTAKKGPIAPSLLASNGNKQKKSNAKGSKAPKEQIPVKKAKLPLSQKRGSDDEAEIKIVVPPNKMKATVALRLNVPNVPQKQVKRASTEKVEGKKFSPKKGNFKGSNKFTQKKGNATPNKKGPGKKPDQQKNYPKKGGKAPSK